MYYFKMNPPKSTKTQTVILYEFQKSTQPHISRKVLTKSFDQAFLNVHFSKNQTQNSG